MKNSSIQCNFLPAVFNFTSNSNIRVSFIKNNPFFIAKDICLALGITWTGHTLDNIPESWKGMVKLTTPYGCQTFTAINEAALYKLAFRSNKPEADRFTNWVVSEVLPSIRKTGAYAVPTPQPHPVLQVPKVKYRYRTRIVPAAMNPQDRKDLEVVRKFREGQGGNLYRVAQTMLDNHTAYMDLIGDGVDYQDLKRRFHHTHDLVKFLLELEKRA